MTRPPDRLLNTVRANQVGSALKTLAPGGRQTLRARAVRGAALGTLRATGLIAIVFNGDDTTTMRPAVLWVLWVGAAVPVNGNDFDARYPVTL